MYKYSVENIKTLLVKNDGFQRGDYNVLLGVDRIKDKVLLRDKYGYCRVLLDDLINNKCKTTSIKSAVFKTNYLTEYVKSTNKDFYNYKYRIISEYTKATNPIKVIDNLGIMYEITPSSFFNSYSLSVRSAVCKLDYYEKFIKSRNKNFKDGSVVLEDVLKKDGRYYIACFDKYGKYIMCSSSALSGSYPTIEVAIDKESLLINKAKEKHGDKYCYDNIKYINCREKVDIICKKHGVFHQNILNHIRGEGCPTCHHEVNLWHYSNWERYAKNSNRFESFKCYIIKLSNKENTETFFKIGKSYNTEERFKNFGDYKVIEKIYIIESSDGKYISQLENELKSLNKDYRYKPKKYFGGRTECFSSVEKINDVIKSIKNNDNKNIKIL